MKVFFFVILKVFKKNALTIRRNISMSNFRNIVYLKSFNHITRRLNTSLNYTVMDYMDSVNLAWFSLKNKSCELKNMYLLIKLTDFFFSWTDWHAFRYIGLQSSLKALYRIRDSLGVIWLTAVPHGWFMGYCQPRSVSVHIHSMINRFKLTRSWINIT